MTPPVCRSSKEKEEAFRKDLQELLTRHRAELRITDDGKPYGMHTSFLEVSMMCEWTEAGEQTDEYTEFKL